MWKIVLGFILVQTSEHMQAFPDLRLPKARHIAGAVVDQTGIPVAEAHVDHTTDRLQTHQTDSEGRFVLDTRAPAIVVRKAGFRSELVRTPDATEIRVTLQKLREGQAFSTCSDNGRHQGISGWGAWFQFAKMSGVRTSRQASDIDYGARSYYIKTNHGRKGIMHGRGPSWSLGTPSDPEVWGSIKYEEVTFDVGGLIINDARGQLADGSRWRYLGMVGESASYSGVDETTTKILDQFLDGACLKFPPRR